MGKQTRFPWVQVEDAEGHRYWYQLAKDLRYAITHDRLSERTQRHLLLGAMIVVPIGDYTPTGVAPMSAMRIRQLKWVAKRTSVSRWITRSQFHRFKALDTTRLIAGLHYLRHDYDGDSQRRIVGAVLDQTRVGRLSQQAWAIQTGWHLWGWLVAIWLAGAIPIGLDRAGDQPLVLTWLVFLTGLLFGMDGLMGWQTRLPNGIAPVPLSEAIPTVERKEQENE